MRKSLLALLSLLVVASMVLAACGGGAPAAPAAPAEEAAATEAPAEEAAAPAEEAAAPAEAAGDRIPVRWFIGLGTGADEAQLDAQQAVVDRFNASQDKVQMSMEIVPNTSARDTLATQIASGNGPDIVGPVGWGGSNAFYGQYLDLKPFIDAEGYDLTQFNEALVDMYQTQEGSQAGLPFAVFPAVVYYQTELFDEAGLNYPPTKYGDKYVMPDGSEVDWNWDTLTEVAKILTVDADGNDATMAEFDPAKIVQYGFNLQWQVHPNVIGTYLGGANSLIDDQGNAQVPESWVEGWKWWHESMWGDQPFVPTGPVTQSPEFGSGNTFASGKVTMAVSPSWYTCCIADAGESWDMAVMPSDAAGKINSRVDADTFRILKDTQHPQETWEVLKFLIGNGSLDLLSVYGGMPARTADFESWLAQKQEQFPFVTNWEPVSAGLSYPDVPSAEGYVPSWSEVWDRTGRLESLFTNQAELDIDAEAALLETDLQAIFDKAAQQ